MDPRVVQQNVGGKEASDVTLLELPEPVLATVFIVHTDFSTKYALRHTCRALRRLLDSSMVSVRLKHTYRNPLAWGWVHDSLVKAINSSKHLTTLITGQALNEQLPHHLKAFKCQMESWQALSRLGQLEVLCVERQSAGPQTRWQNSSAYSYYYDDDDDDGQKDSNWGECGLSGRPQLQYLTSLQRLELAHESTVVGSLAALAPTLKHLEIEAFNQVYHVNQLTNLEVLIVRKYLPSHFFVTHKLPIKHLEWYADGIPFTSADYWKDAPPTLESICTHTLRTYAPGVLPCTVTCLQALPLYYYSLADMAVACPWVQRLDYRASNWPTVSQLQPFAQLRFLNILWSSNSYRDTEMVQSLQAELGKGVKVCKRLNETEVLKHRYTWPKGIQW